jgi:hypothetical protein
MCIVPHPNKRLFFLFFFFFLCLLFVLCIVGCEHSWVFLTLFVVCRMEAGGGDGPHIEVGKPGGGRRLCLSLRSVLLLWFVFESVVLKKEVAVAECGFASTADNEVTLQLIARKRKSGVCAVSEYAFVRLA